MGCFQEEALGKRPSPIPKGRSNTKGCFFGKQYFVKFVQLGEVFVVLDWLPPPQQKEIIFKKTNIIKN